MPARKKTTTTRKTAAKPKAKPAAKEPTLLEQAEQTAAEESTLNDTLKDDDVEPEVTEQLDSDDVQDVMAALADPDSLPIEPIEAEASGMTEEQAARHLEGVEALNAARQSPEMAEVAAAERRAGNAYQYGMTTAATQAQMAAQSLKPVYNVLLKKIVNLMAERGVPGQWHVSTNLEGFYVHVSRHFGHVVRQGTSVKVNFSFGKGPSWFNDTNPSDIGLDINQAFPQDAEQDTDISIDVKLIPCDLSAQLPTNGVAYAPYPALTDQGLPRGFYLDKDIQITYA